MMSVKATVRSNRTTIQDILCGDPTLILSKVHEKELITDREYNILKSSNSANVEKQMVELVDKMMNKGEDTCQSFLDLLQTDDELRATFPKLQEIQLRERSAQSPCASSEFSPDDNSQTQEQYELNSRPVGLCLIINNENFAGGNRPGSTKDAEDLSGVFFRLGFRVLMCEDQTMQQMDDTLSCFASLSSSSQLQGLNLKEWSGSRFTHLQQPPPVHGDAFICCILSHGRQGVVLGVDWRPLCIKQITRTFISSEQSPLNGKPKVFLIQACQGDKIPQGVQLEADDGSYTIPETADVLVACATVEDYKAIRHPQCGSWFVQSVCQELLKGCPRGDDILTILCRVNKEVSLKEGNVRFIGTVRQMPEINRVTLRKRLVLSLQNMQT